MADMFGAPIGVRAFQQDALTTLRGTADAQHTLGQIAMQPLQARRLQAEAGKSEMEAAKMAAEMEAQKTLAAIMKRAQETEPGVAGTGPQKSMADILDSVARTAAGAGLIEEAQKAAKGAAEMRQKEAATVSSQTTAVKNRLDAGIKQAELIGQIFGGADSQESWDRANALYETYMGTKSPFAAIPFDPAARDQLVDASLSQKEKLELERKRLDAEATARYRGARLAQGRINLDIRQAELDRKRERDRVKDKNGGPKAAATIPEANIKAVEDMIRSDFPDQMDRADRRQAAMDIASAARELQRQNPALGASQALARAYADAAGAGDFETTPGASAMGIQYKKPVTKYAGRGKTAATAIPAPTDKSKAVVGRYYIFPGGRIGQLTKEGVKLVDSRVLSGDNGRGSSVEDDDDDE